MSTTIAPQDDEQELAFRPPRRTTTNASVDFIENTVSQAEESRYVPEYDRFLPKDEAEAQMDAIAAVWKDAEIEMKNLSLTVQKLRKKTVAKTSSKDEIIHQQSFTWKEVIAEANDATDRYKKTLFGKICERSGAFEHWLTLLPSDSYAAAISGAFTISIQSARNVSDMHKTIAETLATIPDVMEHAGTYVRIYGSHRSLSLNRKTVDLCKAILVTLRLVIEYIMQGSLKKMTGAVFKGANYQIELKESIKDLENQASRIEKEAMILAQERVSNMDKKADMKELKDRHRHYELRDELRRQNENINERMDDLKQQNAMYCDVLVKLLQANPKYSVRSGQPIGAADVLQLLEYEEVPPESPPKKKSKITVKSLLKSLDHESDFAQKDLDYCLKLGFSETDHFQDRAAWALQAPEVAKFLDGKTGSRFLLINGNDDATQFISPLSYVCAKLADWLSESSSVIQLKYFCSCHPDDWSEPRANAQGIVAQLMGQLLCEPAKNGKKKSFKLDLSEIGTEDESALARDNFGATWRTFEHLVKQLPKGMRVFCFIDGLSAYENSTRKKDISRLMRKMCKLIGSIKNIDLRCMVTCPGRSSHDDTWGVEFDGRKSKAVKLDMPEYI